MTVKNPFARLPNKPGSGEIHLTMLPPLTPTFGTLSYTYPLKLVPSTPHVLSEPSTPGKPQESSSPSVANTTISTKPRTVPLVFLLSYGGGLLPPDAIDLKIRLDAGTRLTMATQGSTKIFPSAPFQQPRKYPTTIQHKPPVNPPLPQVTAIPGPPSTSTPMEDRSVNTKLPGELPTATQTLTVHLAANSALCLTPDPTQPFQGSKYIQRQTFTVDATASLLLLDWTTEGRRARGESWAADLWRGCNEIWRETSDGQPPRLQLRDHVILEGDNQGPTDSTGSAIASDVDAAGRQQSGLGMRALREQNVGCFGTLVVLGHVVAAIGDFFMHEFGALPRVGGRDWGDEEKRADDEATDEAGKARRRLEAWRKERLKVEKEEDVLWTSARVRGLVLVKFSARDAQGARKWLGEMLTFEGTVAQEFGEGGLMSVK